MANEFPSLKARQLRAALARLGYTVERSAGGSHNKLSVSGRPSLLWAFHDGDSLAPGLVRKSSVKTPV